MRNQACKNGCVTPLRFPRRPGENLPVVHADGCLCCAPNDLVRSDNRPALPHFNYRIGTYGTIREWLFHQINQTPTLKNWTHRTPDDPAIALLEGASILGDILTFYQETYANEAFLRTAQWRESISDLVRLLGYRLSPAVGGKATFAFEIKKDEPVVIPVGFPLKATLEEFPKPSDFETTEEITAYPWLSRFDLYRPLVQKVIEPSTTEFYISYPEQFLSFVDLKAGDRLLMGEPVGKAKSPGGTSAGPLVVGDLSWWTNTAILSAEQKALTDANTALDSAQSALAADSEVIDLADKAAEIAASEAPMRAVNEVVKKLVAKASVAWSNAEQTITDVRTAKDSAITRNGRLLGAAGSLSPESGVSNADRDDLLAMLRSETGQVGTAVEDALTAAGDSEAESKKVRSYVSYSDIPPRQGAVMVAANIATSAETASKKADKTAMEAAEKAVRLAAIAASSAAAGASDRVAAVNLARDANDAAGTSVRESGQVKPAIDNLEAKAELTAKTTGIAAILAPFTGGLSLLFGAATVPHELAAWVAAYAKALDEAKQSTDAADNTKGKTQQVVNTLSDSATAAARQSITDRRDAVFAIGEANRLAGLARTAADTMARTRATLISKTNKVIAKAVTAKEKAEATVAAINSFIEAIKAVNTEDIREAVVASGDTVDDAANPARLKNAEIVLVDSIRELHGQKIFKIKGELKRTGSIGELSAFKLGRSFHHFGYNGSPTTSKVTEPLVSTATTKTVNGKTTTTVTSPPIPERNIAFSRFLGATTTSDNHAIRYPGNANTTRIVDPPLGKLEFPLEAEVTDIASGTTLVIQTTLFGSPNTKKQAEFTFVRKITQIDPASLTWGLLTGSTSMVTFDKPLDVSSDGVRYRIADIRDFMIHEAVSPMLTIKRAQEETAVLKDTSLIFYGTTEQVKTLLKRRIMLEKPDAEPQIVSVTQIPETFDPMTAKFPQLYAITVSPEVIYADFPNENPVTTVFGNLADADEGKTLPEAVLGSGNATQTFQNFKIPKPPLTYHIVPENTPPETPEAKIYVDGRMWTKVDSFFDRGADEQIYIIREDADGNSWVQFGDGKSGARLTSGVNNVTAIYRVGAGAFGALKDDTKVQASAKIKNLDKIGMPMVASGGTGPEDGENARIAAPGKVQSLGRIVSLKDFEFEAIAISGVASASAAWQLVDNIPAVVVTVLMETGRSGEIEAVADTLRSYNTSRGAGRSSVHAELGKRKYVTASIDYALKTGYRADLVEPEIRRALGVNFALATGEEDQTGLFSLRRRRFGVREYASTLEGVTQNVEGVLWAKSTAFTNLTNESNDPYIDDPEDLTLPSETKLDPIVPCGHGFILSLYDKHLFLKAVKNGGKAT